MMRVSKNCKSTNALCMLDEVSVILQPSVSEENSKGYARDFQRQLTEEIDLKPVSFGKMVI